MKKSMSRKHHYLPRYYLKGFTDSVGSFYVYDKLNDNIFYINANKAFFENDLNTIVYPNGGTSDFLEKLYTLIENRSWNCLDRIRSSTCNTPIELWDTLHLYYFLLFMHWRLPSNAKFIEALSRDFFLGDNNLDYFILKSKTGEIASKEDIEKITSSSEFKKVAKLIVPFAPFFKDQNFWSHLENWRFIYSCDDKSCFMIGDNPIITRGLNDHDPIRCLHEFIFPVSGKILLISSNILKRRVFPTKFIVQYNAAILERARRFIACQRKDFLESLIKDYKLRVLDDTTVDIVNELFDMLMST